MNRMPPRAPLPMAPQEFSKLPRVRRALGKGARSDLALRCAVFAPALALTVLVVVGIAQWLGAGGLTALEGALLALVALTFVWVSLSVSTVVLALLGLLGRGAPPPQNADDRPALNVALLVPIYNESPEDVFGNASAMLADLRRRPGNDQYTLFILSDTQDPAIAAREEQTLAAMPGSVYYRRRTANVDRKVGNISDWITGWGADYDAMLVLDADSLMSGAAIQGLTDALARDPAAGLIQSFPHLIGAETLFARMQQFSNTIYGWLLADGLALWAQREGNYWGHNAIIRTRAFAESARLPHLRGRGGDSKVILSHDFVEAGMLRRAGWAVRFAPRIAGSFEETPSTLIDYVLRDRRWCQGNLQHLRLLVARGFHPVSRFHLLQGAAAFLQSPAWLALLVVWSALGQMPAPAPVFFDVANPLYPVWPVFSPSGGLVFLVLIYGLLLLPRLASAFIVSLSPATARLYNGRRRFWATTLFEILLSVAYAPIMMVQQTIAVVLALAGRSFGWSAQRRGAEPRALGTLIRFHAIETALGIAMIIGVIQGALSLWLLPIMASLALAVPLSWLSGVNVAHRAAGVLRLDSPATLREPPVVRKARAERARLRAAMMPAE